MPYLVPPEEPSLPYPSAEAALPDAESGESWSKYQGLSTRCAITQLRVARKGSTWSEILVLEKIQSVVMVGSLRDPHGAASKASVWHGG